MRLEKEEQKKPKRNGFFHFYEKNILRFHGKIFIQYI